MTENKKLQVEFAPGCFDQFEGTQEELDALQREILEMFQNLTPEELDKQSRPVDLDDPEMSDEERDALMRFIMSQERTLQ